MNPPLETNGNVRTIRKGRSRVIQEISEKSLFPWLWHVALDWSIIVAAIAFAATTKHPLAYFLAALIIGNRQHALAVLGHDGTHFALHKDRIINDFLSNLFCFWPMLIAGEGYRTLHLTHHKNTGTSQDPELMHKGARAPQWDLPLNRKKVATYLLKDLIGYSVPDLLIILTFSRPEKKSLLIAPIAIHVVAIVGFIATGLWQVPVLWYVSMATSFMMFFRLRLWLEHQGTGDTQRVHLNWWQSRLLAPHNIWLHWEHHEWPTVPYHRLPDARKLVNAVPTLSLAELIHIFENSVSMPSGIALNTDLKAVA
jgi:fatty acid desaturase